MKWQRVHCLIFGIAALWSEFGNARKNSRHDVGVIEFIRNASNIPPSSSLYAEPGQPAYGTKRIARSRVDGSEQSPIDVNYAGVASILLKEDTEELRHSSLTEWKKKKKEIRLANKAAGIKPKPEFGKADAEYDQLDGEVSSGGRMVNVPCSPPHCSFRCLTDQQCVIHPLMEKWSPPKPRICGDQVIHPISFGVPESEVVDCVPLKSADFGTVVPFRERSYVFGPADEAEYKRDYRKAYFGVTRRKEGWDCMRHYEILASGAVPMFLDVSETPSGVLTHLPVKLLKHVRALKAFRVEGCEMKHLLTTCNIYLDKEKLDFEEYVSIACSLLAHTKQHLTTKAMAKYALEASIGQNKPLKSLKVLFLGGSASNSDYLRDLMFHGFRDLLGHNLYEVNTPRYMYDWPSNEASNAAIQNPNTHWGMGFTIARRLHYQPELHLRNSTIVKALLNKKFFDVIVYGNSHRGMPYWSTVLNAGYTKEQVIIFNGEDWRGWKLVEKQQAELGLLDKGNYFLREMPDGCPRI